VLGQAHTPKRRLLPFLLLALGVLVAPAVGGAGRSPTQASLRAQDARIVAESRASALSLYSLDQQLASAQLRLGTLAAQAQALRSEQSELRHELAIARSSTRLASQRLDSRLRALYEQGDVEPLEIVFGATSLDEALSALDSLSRASSQGEDVLHQLKAARVQLNAAARSLSARTAALATALGEARATTRSLEAARASRSAYIGSLTARRRLTEQQLTALEAQVHAADLRTASLDTAPVSQSSAALELASAPPVGVGARAITVSATGYSLGGSTATGLPVGWGVAAVDPSVIPLGTHMTVPGYGEAIAADTGGAIVGATIDLWFPTTGQAMAWGRRIVTISLH
jgi:3D (Asp-Asp-Asp) domain-containing protein/septal ring factor EnvC (AmiA/AmiB activator)